MHVRQKFHLYRVYFWEDGVRCLYHATPIGDHLEVMLIKTTISLYLSYDPLGKRHNPNQLEKNKYGRKVCCSVLNCIFLRYCNKLYHSMLT